MSKTVCVALSIFRNKSVRPSFFDSMVYEQPGHGNAVGGGNKNKNKISKSNFIFLSEMIRIIDKPNFDMVFKFNEYFHYFSL